MDNAELIGPILFCLYINDLPTICTDTECQMYADDTVFYISAKNPCQAAEILSRQMVTVSEWLQRNLLTLNHKKKRINVLLNKKESPREILHNY